MRVPAGELPDDSPRLRGWLHAGAAPLALAAGVVLVALSPPGRIRVASAVFAAAALVNYCASAGLHLGRWRPGFTAYVRRLDHASIFVLIAGSYTPASVLTLNGAHRPVLLTIVWTGAVLGVGFRLAWTGAPRWVYTGLYLLLGWAALVFLTDFADYTPVAVPLLLALGGCSTPSAGSSTAYAVPIRRRGGSASTRCSTP